MKIERKKFNKVLAFGWILIALFIFLTSLNQIGLIKWVGILGSVIVGLIELIFFFKKW